MPKRYPLKDGDFEIFQDEVIHMHKKMQMAEWELFAFCKNLGDDRDASCSLDHENGLAFLGLNSRTSVPATHYYLRQWGAHEVLEVLYDEIDRNLDSRLKEDIRNAIRHRAIQRELNTWWLEDYQRRFKDDM